MKNKQIRWPWIVTLCVLRVLFFRVLLFIAFLVFSTWSNNTPPDWGKPFPEGTQVLLHTDSHQGTFRAHGLAVTVLQIPEGCQKAFENKLRGDEFCEGVPYEDVCQYLQDVEEAKAIVNSQNVLRKFEDRAIAFAEEPFSDWEAAVYDMETGLFCIVEYDE